ncbi:MAG: GTP-binding protein [Gammaproteobacteria bacterium]|nr:GTP-binding protein [Gammaproteobacteria bacterium]
MTNDQLPKEGSHSLLPIHVITGFLGSGKTTLLNKLLQQAGMRHTAVIVNEFGEIGLDHLLIQASTEDIVMLDGGCLCCSVRGDLLVTLEDLLARRARKEIPEFEQILIETSGLADPAPILRTLMDDAFVCKHYRLEMVVTAVDALYGAGQLGEHDESVKQAALAHHLVLTKTDLAEAAAVESLKKRLGNINPGAVIHDIQNGVAAETLFKADYYDKDSRQLDVERWLQVGSYRSHRQQTAPKDCERRDAYIRTYCIEHSEPLPWLVLERWIKQLTHLRGKDLLRVKGIAYTCETDLPVIIQGVQHIFQAPVTLDAWPDEHRGSKIVFITRNIEKTMVEKNLYALIKSKTPVDACAAALILLENPAA